MRLTPYLILLHFSVFSAAAAAVDALAAEVPKSGVTSDRIYIGQSAVLEGPSAELGRSMKEGAQAYFRYVNEVEGGIYGRKVELLSLNDDGNPKKALANTKELIERGVFALFGYVGTMTSHEVVIEYHIPSQYRIPYIGAFSGALGLRREQPFVFNVRASYYKETEELAKWLSQNKKKRIGLFYHADLNGHTGAKGIYKAIEKYDGDIKIVSVGVLERNFKELDKEATDAEIDKAAKELMVGEPDAIVMICSYSSGAKLIHNIRSKYGYRELRDLVFAGLSVIGGRPLAESLRKDAHGVVVSQVVPHPKVRTLEVIRDFQKHLQEFDPKAVPSFNNLEGYIAARVLVEGLKKTGPNLTRDGFAQAMSALNVDLGDYRITYAPGDHDGSEFVQITTIIGSEGGFTY